MRFLLDACAGNGLAVWLRSMGHDVEESRDRGPDPGDRTVLQWAAAEDRILITLDKHFGLLVYGEKAAHCGLVRLPDVPAARRIVLMEQVIARHADDLSQRAVVTVRGGRIRVSRMD